MTSQQRKDAGCVEQTAHATRRKRGATVTAGTGTPTSNACLNKRLF